MSSMGPGAFGRVLRSFYEVRWHSLGIFHHPHSLPFDPLHSDNFQKTELLMVLTQLITLKVEFREEYLAEQLRQPKREDIRDEMARSDFRWLEEACG